jgi:EAL domain-containing protein (putative c-di-GMP-specific phosphodiesterase class I)
MLAIAKSLGMCTIAEGIETAAQHEFLLHAGCSRRAGLLLRARAAAGGD